MLRSVVDDGGQTLDVAQVNEGVANIMSGLEVTAHGAAVQRSPVRGARAPSTLVPVLMRGEEAMEEVQWLEKG